MGLIKYATCFGVVLWILGHHLTICNGQSANCSGSTIMLSGSSGEIVSHDGFGLTNYSDNMRCYWQINVPLGYRVAAWFTYLGVENGNDRMTLYDGVRDAAILAIANTTINSTHLTSPQYVSTANIMTVFYSTSDSGSHKGFRLVYNTTNSPIISSCQPLNFTSLSNTSGSIISHASFGSTPYSSNMSCLWVLPELSQYFIQLSVTNLSLGDGDCLYINTNKGSYYGGNPSTTYCGWMANNSIMLQMSGTLNIWFISNAKYESSGFQIQVTYNLYCQPNVSISTDGFGEIVSHTGFGTVPYWSNMNCRWGITTQPGFQIMFWFSFLSVYYCCDYIHVWDLDSGNHIVSTVNGLTGPITSPTVYESRSKGIVIHFITDSNGPNNHGFKVQYNVSKLYCNGFQNISAGSGEIASHYRAGSTYYLRNMDCYWQINAPIGSRVSVWLSLIQLYPNNVDRMVIYDGNTNVSALAIFQYYHGTTGPIYISTNNILTVYFRSDINSPGYPGFRMRYEVKGNPSLKSCVPLNITSNTTGTIQSHYQYGSTPYPSGMSCSWTLPQRSGYYIYLELLHLHQGGADCLLITSNSLPNSGSSPNMTYCGWNYITNIFLVMAGTVQINFTSDSAYESLGFSIRYEYAYSCVSTNQWTADTGEILSHSGVGTVQYMGNVQCNWLISVSPGKQVIAWFTYLRLNDNGDQVSLLDGMSGSTVRLQYRDRYQIDPMVGFTSSSNYMRVAFSTDQNGFGLGFRLQYDIADNYCPYQLNLFGNGEIVSHKGYNVTNYLNNINCNWQVTAPPDNNVVLMFTFLNLSSSSSDVVTVFDGISGSTIAQFRGDFSNRILYAIVTIGNVLRVTFTTDSFHTALGFRLEYNTSESYCRGWKYVSADTGELQSHSTLGSMRPMYPSFCYWVVTVSSDKRIFTWFTYFNLLHPYDNVYLYDGMVGMTTIAELSNSFTSVYNTSSFLSSSNTMTVYFRYHNGYISANHGFRMKYMATESFCKAYRLIQGGSGDIASHREAGLSPYANNMRCVWQILAAPGVQISASLSYVDLMTASDTLTLTDGPSETAIFNVVGGSTVASIRFLTLSNILTVRFQTDGFGNGLGFKLQYNAGIEVSPSSTTTASQPTSRTTDKPASTVNPPTPGPFSTPGNHGITRSTILGSSIAATERTEAAGQSQTTIIIVVVAVGAAILAALGGVIGYLIHNKRKEAQGKAQGNGTPDVYLPGASANSYVGDIDLQNRPLPPNPKDFADHPDYTWGQKAKVNNGEEDDDDYAGI